MNLFSEPGNSKRKNSVYCSVYGCKSYYSSDISFHFFPKENTIKVLWTSKNSIKEYVDKRLLWAKQLWIDKDILKKNLHICSKHFTPLDFHSLPPGIYFKTIFVFESLYRCHIFNLGTKLLKTRFKEEAIPSQYLPKSICQSPVKKTRRISPKKRQFLPKELECEVICY